MEEGLYRNNYEHDSCGIGLVANISGKKDHRIITRGIEVLTNLEHRGAIGSDGKTGDGSGMLLEIPHELYQRTTSFDLPLPGIYGTGIVFLSQERKKHDIGKEIIRKSIENRGASLLGWREVPHDPDCLGPLGLQTMPSFQQLCCTCGSREGLELERELFVLRKTMEQQALKAGLGMEDFTIVSLSSRTIVYKGMFLASQFPVFYPDLMNEDCRSAFAIVHQRYSTNTLPAWHLAQPFRRIAHNGEINTIRRNLNNMKARETTLESALFSVDVKTLGPLIMEEGSDSAMLDNVFELLSLGGRSIEHTMAMMVPEPFGRKYHISEDRRAFYEYHAAIMEPWDGPAALLFTDGEKIGAILDRNGLRPLRYTISKSGFLVAASETGVLTLAPEHILEKGKLSPGKMLLVDLVSGRVKKDNEIKASVTRRQPYRRWLEENRIELKGLFQVPGEVSFEGRALERARKVFGYTREDIYSVLFPMARDGQEPLGSMGNDTPPAVLSDRSPLLYDYFKQIFAQVTNPPIDPYRENLVMSLMSFVGRERNLLSETPQHCRQLKLLHPLLSNDDLIKLKEHTFPDFRTAVVPVLFHREEEEGLEGALDKIAKTAERRIDEGASLIILSDRGMTSAEIPIPALLAMGAVHHYLVRRGKRHRSGIILETGEARTVHHMGVLVGYGASGINPYLAFETITEMVAEGYFPPECTQETVMEQYIKAIKKGLLKTMSKIGISTIRSYRGSQIYEVIGLDQDLVDRYFTGSISSFGGTSLKRIEKETKKRHSEAFNSGLIASKRSTFEPGGRFRYRRGGEKHRFSPEAIVQLQRAVRENSFEDFLEFSRLMNTSSPPLTLRSLFDLKKDRAVPLKEVEGEEQLMKRFVASAMSFGSISREAHETIAMAMNSIGGMSNSGEGGEDSSRWRSERGAAGTSSAVKQVASARFGVTLDYLVHAEELQIKIAQGAKPGEGGQLPGHKVDATIAAVRNSTPGVGLISPPPHHDIYSIEDLAQLIFDLKRVNPRARVSVKLVAESGVGTIAAGVAKAKADLIVISGGDGGTGSSPLTSIHHAGSLWEIGLAETQEVLRRNGLREGIRLQVDGQIRTGRDVVIGALLGAEEFGFATVVLVTLGCVMMRKCHLNTCPVGIATQNADLRQRYSGKPEYLVRYFRFLARDTRRIMAELGARSFDELVGRKDCISLTSAEEYCEKRGINFSRILFADGDGGKENSTTKENRKSLKRNGVNREPLTSLEDRLLRDTREAREMKKKVRLSYDIKNSHRTMGASLSGVIARKYGGEGLPKETIQVDFHGSAGQSFGAFLVKGVSFRLHGDANDYLGKGLSGGKIVVVPPQGVKFQTYQNSIAGNVCLFGATSGEVYISGTGGERFCVRNSGARAVIEGVGDHGCEYMTGGSVAILGPTGINFAAGMSGGIAFVFDENQLFDTRCNLETVDVETVSSEKDKKALHSMIDEHFVHTGSPRAKEMLENWEYAVSLFVKVMPMDYRIALERLEMKDHRESELAEMTEEVYV